MTADCKSILYGACFYMKSCAISYKLIIGYNTFIPKDDAINDRVSKKSLDLYM